MNELHYYALLHEIGVSEEMIEDFLEWKHMEPFSFELVANQNTVNWPPNSRERALNLANSLSRFRKNKLYEKQKAEGKTRILAEGDSWFEYPLKKVSDILNHLGEHYAVYSLAGGGDVLRSMFFKPNYYKIIEKEKPDFFLISAGGNDILGKKFEKFLNPYLAGEPGQNVARFFNSSLHKEIRSLGEIFQTIFRQVLTKHSHLQIVVHGYDYVTPLNHRKKGWLGRYLLAKGIENEQDHQAALKYIIDLFNEMLHSAAEKFNGQVHYLDLRGTIQSHQWHDEIHPSSQGFQDISIKFMKVLDPV